MTRKVPIVPTLIVLAACATMIALGFWQLDRKAQKEALLARYAQAQTMSSAIPWPSPADYESALYRHARVDCTRVLGIDATAGRSESGVSGWAHIARCRYNGPGAVDIALGWSRSPESPRWGGGEVGGMIGPYGKVVKLVASPPQAGLEQLAMPDPADIPNNHLAYAGQWFFFALTALVIYMLALRRRWVSNSSPERGGGPPA